MGCWRPTCSNGGRWSAWCSRSTFAADSRPLDRQLLQWLAPRGLAVGVLLTKADKLGRGAALQQQRDVANELEAGARLTRFSATARDGVAEARSWLDAWLGVEQEP